ncbi:MAG: hypothetical protein FWH40_04825 [Coriobacteriia bacterium]|nr:hypothetical protein [Coriobacteriia bacterium]
MAQRKMRQRALRKSRLTKAAEASAGRYMPPRRHKAGEGYSVYASEVADFLCSLPEVRQLVVDVFMEKGLIEYDPATGLWAGKAWAGPAPGVPGPVAAGRKEAKDG